MSKKYPVRITDPSSDNHVVRVHPNQDFIVYCPTKGIKPEDITLVSQFFMLTHKSPHTLRFKQIGNLSKIENRFYLGDVLLDTDMNKPIAKLSVVLEAEKKARLPFLILLPTI